MRPRGTRAKTLLKSRSTPSGRSIGVSTPPGWIEFTLLRLGARAPDAAFFAAAAKARGVPLAVVDVVSDEARDLYAADLALIRPDQIVAWRGNSAAHADDVALVLAHEELAVSVDEPARHVLEVRERGWRVAGLR